jgi:hypothetical protein
MEFHTNTQILGFFYAPKSQKIYILEGGTKLYELNLIEYHLGFVTLLLVFNSK